MFKVLYKKEVMQIFNSPFGFIVTALFALFANFMFIKDIFVLQSASLRPFFATIPWIILIFAAAVSMRTFAEERRTNTIETLLTLPISDGTIVAAKFAVTMTVMIVGLALTLAFPVTMAMTNELFQSYLPQVFSGYIGAMFLAALFVSVGMLCSLLSRSQVAAFLVASVVTFMMFAFTSEFASGFIPRIVSDPLSLFAPSSHYDTFVKGVVDIRSLWFFVGTITLLQFVIVALLKKRS